MESKLYAVVGAHKNQNKWNKKIDVHIYLYSNVVTIKNKTDLKFCLTMVTKGSHNEFILKIKYKALK